jgi:3-oxoacyl-(acyl-carrier-protein) synthase
VVSYDFLSPFVTGGFHALKILNAGFPAPYRERATGSIGLGDGAAFAILARGRGGFALGAHSLHNEMFHATANQPGGEGFAAAFAPAARAAAGRGLRNLWVKGHGTGTLEAGRLETAAVAAAFPGARLTGWKGGLGHTLGSCGLVELAVAAAAMRGGRAPGVADGGGGPALAGHVALDPINTSASDGVVCASNAFGGAHAALLLHHA